MTSPAFSAGVGRAPAGRVTVRRRGSGRDGGAGRGWAAPAVGVAAGAAARVGGSGRSGSRAVLLGVRVLLPQPRLLLRGQPLCLEERAAQGPPGRHQAALHQCPGGVQSVAPLRAALEGTDRHPGTSLLTLMGFRLEGIFPAALLPLLLTMILFLGPLMQLSMDCPCDLADGLKVVLAPRSWARCLTDMRWLRNQVIAPLTEELVFRACMLPMLAPCTGLGPAVFTCPLFFGVAHFHHIFEQLRFRQNSVGSIILSAGGACRCGYAASPSPAFQFSYTAVFGAYTAFLFIRTGHLIGPVLCHSFCNYMGFPAVCAALEHPQRRPLLAGYALGVGLFLLLLQPLTDPKLYGSLPLCALLERAGDSEVPLCS
ncbi:CAAX prenyl protease 2 isoform X4 [Rhinolophus ferrumequinum]|uniref:CAAX prenyl protease 2 isoform X4 n=1 Tax=Rhinolophus ferrumequinum TaxID=59479 RepID=UPI00140FC436|nr:CAAX prenyl protease 2 isoform X4 [Rhinolophus ferrumequinum]